MDSSGTSFSGPDFASSARPFIFWANSNYDRYVLDSDGTNYYDDDVPVAGDYFTDSPTPDCNFRDGAGHRIIPSVRDLQDFTRLWVSGVNSNLLNNLPSGSTITLNWEDVGSPNPTNPTIDLFMAADPDGGIGYLTNDVISASQVESVLSPYTGRLGPGQSIQLNGSQFSNNWAGNYFIWCGVSNGSGALNLTIADGGGNTLAQATIYVQIVDIKQMYERWTVGDNPNNAPTNIARIAQDGLGAGEIPFQFGEATATNTPYILYVHGWNMQLSDKDRFAECAFKRLYWQGYQGRFGVFRWPTDYGFTGSWWQTLTDPRNYDNSEFTAWQSAAGLANKLTSLSAQYPNNVYVLAHSMGNVVTGEALRLAAQAGSGQIVNTYVASQAAFPAHDYDSTVTAPWLLPFTYTYPTGVLNVLGSQNYGPRTPNIYGNLLASNAAAVGKRVNFFNTNDYALAMPRWGFDQILKPDTLPLGGYSYTGNVSDSAPWNHFGFTPEGGSFEALDIVANQTNHYEAIAYAAQAYSTALGATPVVGGVGNIDLQTIWPADPSGHIYADHFWHSAEFRGDAWQQWSYWSELLDSAAFNLR